MHTRYVSQIVTRGANANGRMLRAAFSSNSDIPMRAMLIGAPGSGKGTLAKRLVRDFGFEHVSSGDVLRQQMADGTSVGKEAQSYVKEGKLVPDEVMVELMATGLESLEASGCKKWLLDGFPRTESQAQALDEKFDLGLVMHLDVPDEEIIERIRHRFVHLDSGRVYHAIWNPPKVSGVDDVTGEPLIQRQDDKPDVVKDRLVKYWDLTMPITKHYANKGILGKFSGTESDVIYPTMKMFVDGWIVGANVASRGE
eukprot:g1516.t1